MDRVLLVISLSCLASCASMPELFPVVFKEPAPLGPTEAATLAASAETIDVDDLDNGKVCRSERRAGSRIEETFCYTREEHAAVQEQRGEQIEAYINALDQDQRNREIAQQQMAQERRSRAAQIR